MTERLIPPIGTKGLYKLEVPFASTIREKEIYECAAIRYFTDLENNGSDVFEIYYKPYGLTEENYFIDRSAGHVLITLLSPKYPPVYVPSSYIRSYPSLVSRKYNQVILSASLGPLPDDVVLEPTMQAMQNALSDFIGAEVLVNVGVMPLTDAVSPEEHETREAARLGAISTRDTAYARVVELETANSSLNQRIVMLEKIIKDKGLLGAP